MKIISEMVKSAYHILGYQHYDQTKNYEKIPYLVNYKQDNGVLMCNTLTREIIWISDGEDGEELKKFLVEHWFLLPESTSPDTLCYLFMQQHRNRYGSRSIEGIQRVTILTTTNCNARCPYCYESGCEKRTMTQKLAIDVAKFIEVKGSRQRLTLKWFGGEPLCNAEAINSICEYLHEKNIEYTSMMVTNGLLIDQHSMDKMLRVWRLSTVQITLDGTKSEYERIKGYSDSSNAYERVLDNIDMLLKFKIHVDVRLNLSKENYNDLKELAKYLAERFAAYGAGRFVVYSHTLFEGDEGLILSDEERKQMYTQNIDLQKLLKKLGIGSKSGLPKIRHTNCMADDGISIVVMPGGEIGLCEHHCDDEYIGTIYDDEWNQDKIRKWKELEVDSQDCPECFYRPFCSRLKHCPGKTPCTEPWREYLKKKVIIAMESAYKQKKRREQNDI